MYMYLYTYVFARIYVYAWNWLSQFYPYISKYCHNQFIITSMTKRPANVNLTATLTILIILRCFFIIVLKLYL